MDKIVAALINWLTLGPLKGYRTQILALLSFVLAGLYGTHHLSWLTAEQYAAITGLLSGAMSLTAAEHKP